MQWFYGILFLPVLHVALDTKNPTDVFNGSHDLVRNASWLMGMALSPTWTSVWDWLVPSKLCWVFLCVDWHNVMYADTVPFRSAGNWYTCQCLILETDTGKWVRYELNIDKAQKEMLRDQTLYVDSRASSFGCFVLYRGSWQRLMSTLWLEDSNKRIWWMYSTTTATSILHCCLLSSLCNGYIIHALSYGLWWEISGANCIGIRTGPGDGWPDKWKPSAYPKREARAEDEHCKDNWPRQDDPFIRSNLEVCAFEGYI